MFFVSILLLKNKNPKTFALRSKSHRKIYIYPFARTATSLRSSSFRVKRELHLALPNLILCPQRYNEVMPCGINEVGSAHRSLREHPIMFAFGERVQVPVYSLFNIKNNRQPFGYLLFLVRETGLEPVRDYHTPLKRARLPIPPLSQVLIYYTTQKLFCQHFFQNFLSFLFLKIIIIFSEFYSPFSVDINLFQCYDFINIFGESHSKMRRLK